MVIARQPKGHGSYTRTLEGPNGNYYKTAYLLAIWGSMLTGARGGGTGLSLLRVQYYASRILESSGKRVLNMIQLKVPYTRKKP